jgi:hypothetical protein
VVANRKYRASMDAVATEAEIAAVQSLLDELALSIQVQSDHTARGAIEVLPWTLTIAIPATTFLAAFARRFGERVADATAEALDETTKVMRRWISRLYASRAAPDGYLVVTDIDLAVDIWMPRDLSSDCYRQLTHMLETMANCLVSRPSELHWTDGKWIQRFL